MIPSDERLVVEAGNDEIAVLLSCLDRDIREKKISILDASILNALESRSASLVQMKRWAEDFYSSIYHGSPTSLGNFYGNSPDDPDLRADLAENIFEEETGRISGIGRRHMDLFVDLLIHLGHTEESVHALSSPWEISARREDPSPQRTTTWSSRPSSSSGKRPTQSSASGSGSPSWRVTACLSMPSPGLPFTPSWTRSTPTNCLATWAASSSAAPATALTRWCSRWPRWFNSHSTDTGDGPTSNHDRDDPRHGSSPQPCSRCDAGRGGSPTRWVGQTGPLVVIIGITVRIAIVVPSAAGESGRDPQRHSKQADTSSKTPSRIDSCQLPG